MTRGDGLPDLVLVAGTYAAGKSTLARKLADAIPAPPANASDYVLIGVPTDGETSAGAEEKPF